MSVVCVCGVIDSAAGWFPFVFFNGNTHYCFLTSWNEVCTTSAVSVTARLLNFAKLKFEMIFQPQLHAEKQLHRC